MNLHNDPAHGQGKHQKEIKPAPRWLWLVTVGALVIVIAVILCGYAEVSVYERTDGSFVTRNAI